MAFNELLIIYSMANQINVSNASPPSFLKMVKGNTFEMIRTANPAKQTMARFNPRGVANTHPRTINIKVTAVIHSFLPIGPISFNMAAAATGASGVNLASGGNVL